MEGKAANERHEIRSRVRMVLLHLLKWKWQPDKRSPSWRSTLTVQGAEIGDRLEASPSLKASLQSSFPGVYRSASIWPALRPYFPVNIHLHLLK